MCQKLYKFQKYIIEGRCFDAFLRMYLLNFFSRQIRVSIENYEISVRIKYFMRDLIYDIDICA